MGTTLTALQSGSMSFVYVIRLEAYSSLFTNGNAADVNGLAIGDWTSTLTGCTVALDNQQTLDPWDPFTGGGTCTVSIPPDTTTGVDQFGVDVAKTNAGIETYLRATVNRSDTILAVKSTSSFPASGTAYCGTECFDYTQQDATNFTATKRGKYSEIYGSSRFVNQHRVVTASNGVRLEPVVSTQPRSWIGRRVGVWMHRTYGAPGTAAIDSAANAQLVFPGIITEIREDPNTGNVVIMLDHVLSQISKCTVGGEMWSANASNGFYMNAGMTWTFADLSGATSTPLTATPLVVVGVGTTATGTNQINEGLYAIEEITSFLNSWLASELQNSRINGSYTINCPEDDNGTPKTVMHWRIPNAGAAYVAWTLKFPNVQWGDQVFGVPGPTWTQTHTDANVSRAQPSTNPPGSGTAIFRDQSPLLSTVTGGMQLFVEQPTGTFQDQYATLPASVKTVLPPGGQGRAWGMFTIGQMIIVGRPEGATIRDCLLVVSPLSTRAFTQTEVLNFKVGLKDPPPPINQIFVHEGSFATLMKWFAYSTGSIGYNDPSFDILPANQGLGLPSDILGTFKTSCDNLPGANATLTVVVDKPRQFIDLFKADNILRRCHLVWKNQSLVMTAWSTPAGSLATLALTESTKAESATTTANFRSAPVLDSSWVKNLVKINYNRDVLTASGTSSTYRNWVSIEDSVSVDDQGGQATALSIDCCNVYADNTDTGQGVLALLPGFMAWMPYFSRPIRKITRSIDLRYFEGYTVGDMVAVTDPFLRNSTTGLRGVTAKPGLIVRHRYSLGGASDGDPTSTTAMAGEVDIVFLETERIGSYSPTAQVDETQAGSGYDGSFTLTCYAHKHSEPSEPADATWFPALSKVRIIEIDPADPGAPLTWLRTVQSQSGNTIVLTAGIATPAWDSAKAYRIVSDAYANASTTQQGYTYSAGTDSTIQQLVPADQYGGAHSLIAITTMDHVEIPELHSLASYGPNTGAPRDAGVDRALAILADNLMDHKTSRQRPTMNPSVQSNTTYTTGYQTLSIQPYFFGSMALVGGLNRRLAMAPWFRSLDGSTVSVRISVTGVMPTDTTMNDILIKAPAQSNTWTTQSTSYVAGAEQFIYLANYNGLQYGYVIIEATYQGAVRGLAQCVERERVQL